MRCSSGSDVMYFLKPGHQPACQCHMRANRLFGFLSYRFRILQFPQLCFSVIFDLLAACPSVICLLSYALRFLTSDLGYLTSVFCPPPSVFCPLTSAIPVPLFSPVLSGYPIQADPAVRAFTLYIVCSIFLQKVPGTVML